MTKASPELLQKLRDLLGPKGIVEGTHDREPYLLEWRERFSGERSL